MQDNHRFISGNTIYTKTTILESTVDKYGNQYQVHHFFKEIIKKNDSIDKSIDEKINLEDDELSPDLNDKTTKLGYNEFSQKMSNSDWERSKKEQLKINKDMPKILQMVDNSRYEISKRVFGS